VESFAPGTRFAKERLWHVEITFAQPVGGPLIIGDGRYLGLGLMEPVRASQRDLIVFRVPLDARVTLAEVPELLHAVRRAIMALARHSDGTVPPLFSGHEPSGAPAASGHHRHAFLACADLEGGGYVGRLIVAAPWACDRLARPGRGDRALFERIAGSLAEVRAGRLGVFRLRACATDVGLVGPARCWESHTDYRPTRHAKGGREPEAALLRDIVGESERRGLPRPEPQLLGVTAGPRGGIAARLCLRFAVAVAGPILLGRDSHLGGGLFLTKGSETASRPVST
jgi:CRISPR-associated protein Csb2